MVRAVVIAGGFQVGIGLPALGSEINTWIFCGCRLRKVGFGEGIDFKGV